MGLRSLRCLIRSTQLLVSYVCKLERRQPQGQQCTTVPTRHPSTIRSATLSCLYLVDISGSISGIQHGALSALLLLLSIRTMSQTHSNASSSSNFQSVFNAALDAYERKAESNLLTHPLAAQLQSCDSPTAILSAFQELIQQFDCRHRNDQRLTN
jgi:hypothetical protein